MQLVNLSINRIIIHQIFKRNEEGKKVDPILTHSYTRLAPSAMNTFKSRIVDSVGEGSKAVTMEIVDQSENDLSKLIDNMIGLDNEEFVTASFDIPRKLINAQTSRAIPGGIVVIFTGTQGAPSRRFLGIIKAEIYNGYEKLVDPNTQEISLKFVEELLLTPSSRLYKTAMFYEKPDYSEPVENLNNKWLPMVSDAQINQSDGKAAAKYFYADFLGCGYPQTSARTTKQFYDSAATFIDEMNISSEKKNDLFNALTTYLKVDASPTVSTSDFASTYFDVDTQDVFQEFMNEQGIPSTAFTKDIEHIEGKLKFRRLNFSKNVKITAPSDVFKNFVTIETIDGDTDESGSVQKWTKIIVKDQVVKQE